MSPPCIIGYGNPFRRDDGIGAFVAERVRTMLGREARILCFRELDPVVLEHMRDSDLVILVDATVESLGEGMEWRRVRPEGSGFGHTTHHFKPSLLLNLLSSLHDREPETWLLSIQGDDFGHGEGLTKEARARAVKACRQIADFVASKSG
jgi:hydrogenase maturation protease